MWKLEGFTEKFECISYITISIFFQFLRTVECARTLKNNNKKEPKCSPMPKSGKPCPLYLGLSCQMAVVTILARSPMFQLVKFISPLDNDSPDVLALIYWMYL